MRTAAIGLTLALVLTACGDDDSGGGTSTAPPDTGGATSTAAPTTSPPATDAPTTAAAVETEYGTWAAQVSAPGECIDVTFVAEGETDFSVPPSVVDCNGPHDQEVYFVGEYPAGPEAPFPSEDDQFATVFDELCAASHDALMGADYQNAGLISWGYWPDEEDWNAGGRRVICAAANFDNDVDGTQLQAPVAADLDALPGLLMAAIAEFDEIDLHIYIYGPAGEVLDRVNLTADGSALMEVRTPVTWSPDLTKIAYVAQAAGEEQEIWVVDVGTAEKANITNHPADDGGPVFSPDGTKILFTSDRNSEDLDIFVMDVDGTNITQLTFDADRESSPDWSPDGSQIVFRKRMDGNSDIWIMDADGSNQRFFRGTAGGEFDPDWSPDGSQIAFISDFTETGAFDIFVAPVDGEGTMQLTMSPANEEYPEWTPDGAHIVFNSDRYGFDGLFVMASDGSGQAALTWDFPVGHAQIVQPPV